MQLSTTWVIVIIVIVMAVIISNITLLLKSNKSFKFPDNYEKDASPDDDEPPEDKP